MKIKLNPHAMAAAATLAGAVFFGAPGAYAQQTPPASTPSATPPPAPSAPSAATPPPSAATPPPAGETPAPAAGGESKIHAAPPPPPVERHVTKPVIVAGAIGAAGLASGVVFGILAAGKNSSYKKMANNQDALDGERNAFIADVSFGVAALFTLTAIALYFLPDEPTPAADTTAPPAAPKASGVRSWVNAALKGEVLSF